MTCGRTHDTIPTTQTVKAGGLYHPESFLPRVAVSLSRPSLPPCHHPPTTDLSPVTPDRFAFSGILHKYRYSARLSSVVRLLPLSLTAQRGRRAAAWTRTSLLAAAEWRPATRTSHDRLGPYGGTPERLPACTLTDKAAVNVRTRALVLETSRVDRHGACSRPHKPARRDCCGLRLRQRASRSLAENLTLGSGGVFGRLKTAYLFVVVQAKGKRINCQWETVHCGERNKSAGESPNSWPGGTAPRAYLV